MQTGELCVLDWNARKLLSMQLTRGSTARVPVQGIVDYAVLLQRTQRVVWQRSLH